MVGRYGEDQRASVRAFAPPKYYYKIWGNENECEMRNLCEKYRTKFGFGGGSIKVKNLGMGLLLLLSKS